MSGRTCPGWRDDGSSFDPDACRAAHADDEVADLYPAEDECRCSTDCGDPGDGAGCCYCNRRDVYEACPIVGYGCGSNARPYVWHGEVKYPTDVERCDCCTDAEWAAASTPTAATVAAMVG